MIFTLPHKEVSAHVERLNQHLIKSGSKKLSRAQVYWLSFCMTAMIVTNTFSWSRFERASGKSYAARALASVFRHSNIPWDKLFYMSMKLVIMLYNISSGSLVTDDTDRRRSKKTKKIYGVHKIKDKKTNGFVQAQEFVILLLVTPTISLPVGFALYQPDPFLKMWQENDHELKAKGIKKSERPRQPKRDKRYPTKQTLALKLMRQFRYKTASIVDVKSILADAAYMSRYFLSECAKIFSDAQAISQIKRNQKVRAGSKPEVSAEEYFESARSQKINLRLRGRPPIVATIASARLYVRSLGRRMLIVALKYEGEVEYRYLAASDLTWRSLDVAQQYSWRWIIEVFNQDWKMYEGWGQVALQQDEDGTRNGVILSLLLDHSLLLHSDQIRLARQAQPLWTVGSLSRRMQLDSLLDTVRCALEGDDPKGAVKRLADQLEDVVVLRPSDKHLCGKNVTPFGPRPSLAKRFANTG